MHIRVRVDRSTWESDARPASANEVLPPTDLTRNLLFVANSTRLRRTSFHHFAFCIILHHFASFFIILHHFASFCIILYFASFCRPPSVAAPASLQTGAAPTSATLFSSTSWTRCAGWGRRRSTRMTSRKGGWRCSSSSTLMDPFQSLPMAGIPPGLPGRLVLRPVLEAQGRGVRLTLRL